MMPASSTLSLADKARLGAEILLAYVRVKHSLSVGNLPSALARLRGRPPGRFRSILLPDGERDGDRLARAVVRTTRALPTGSRCLTRSLVLLDVLARRGVNSDLVIAVLPGEQLSLDAHAWVEVDGRPLLAPAPNYGRLVTL